MRVAELPVVTFTRAVSQVALPAVRSLQSAADLSRTRRTMLMWILSVNGAAAVLIVLFAEPAIVAVAGSRWIEAVPIMRILAVAMIFRAVVVLTGQLLDGLGEPARTLRLNAERLGVLLVALPPLAMRAGLHGVALAVLVTNVGAALRAEQLSARAIARTNTTLPH